MSEVHGTGSSGGIEYYIRGYQHEGGRWAPTNSHRGRLLSWVAVGLILLGAAAAGLGIVLAAWWPIIAGGVLAVAGAVLCAVAGVSAHGVLGDSRAESEAPRTTARRRIKKRDRASAEARLPWAAPGRAGSGRGRDAAAPEGSPAPPRVGPGRVRLSRPGGGRRS